MNKDQPRYVAQEITSLSMLRHGDHIVVVRHGKKVNEGILQGRPWSNNHPSRVGRGKPQPTILRSGGSELVNNMVTIAPTLRGSNKPLSKDATQDYQVDEQTKILRIVPT